MISLQHQRLKQWCQANGFTMAVVLRGLVARFLDDQAAQRTRPPAAGPQPAQRDRSRRSTGSPGRPGGPKRHQNPTHRGNPPVCDAIIEATNPVGLARIRRGGGAEAQGVNVVEPIWLVPPPGLGVRAAGTGAAATAGDPSRRLNALVEGGAVAARMWALRGPEAARRAWRAHARLGLAALDERLQRPGGDADRFSLAMQASMLGQWAWLAGEADAGRRADLVACELATGGWPGRAALDQPDLVLLNDPTGLHALAHAGSRVRLGMIRDFPVASPLDGGSWKRPGTVDRLLDHVDRQAHLGDSLLGAAARLLRTLVHPAVGPPWPRAAAVDAQRRLAALAGRDMASWTFGLPWLLDTAERFPHRLAPLLAA